MTEKPRTADPEQRLLVLAPTPRDARLTCDILQRSGIESLPCADLPELCRHLREGAAGALLPEESFSGEGSKLLLRFLAEQPSWSDLPIIFLTGHGEYTPRAQRAMETLGNILLLERPTKASMLVSAARAALRERRRQYTVRDQLGELDRRRAALEENEQALVRARREAEEANRAKSEFLANMSHEIRTPMTAFMAAIEHLQDIDSDPEHLRILDMADRSARRLRTLIDEILDFSRIEARRVELKEEPFDLRSWLGDILEMFSLPAREKNLRLEMDLAADAPGIVIGDPDRLGQVLINLLGNALKFTHEGEIHLRVRPRGGFLEFSVSDTGIGMPEENRNRLFESFSQADASFTRRYGGTGLGLAISKGLVELMGGEISVWSRAGEGSSFTFTIPMKTAGTETAEPPAAAEGPAVQPDAARILLAEDEPLVREMISLMLKKRGLRTETARTGREALERWEEGDFDLILMDLQMPEMDGIEATQAIRRREGEGEGRTCIVGLTAHALPEIREQCLSAGMDEVLTKPLQMTTLFSAIESCLSG